MHDLLTLLCLCLSIAPVWAVSFDREVLAVLARGGCNQGACHGNLNGKGGFKLSLRGEDPAFDLVALTRDTLARRVDPLRPVESLLLLKATGGLPHEGGRRFGPETHEYRLLHEWIAAGARADVPHRPALTRLSVEPAEQVIIEPTHDVRLRVWAEFGTGPRQDVTHLTYFEASNPAVAEINAAGVVQRQQFGETAVSARYLGKLATARLAFVPARPGFVWQPVPEFNLIDRPVFAKLQALRVQPSELANDSVFLRRVYLDTLGVLPSVSTTRAFLADPHPDKRAKLIDQLVHRPEFADYWALKWSDLLRNEEKQLDRKGVQVFHHWIRQAIVAGTPLNEFARELISGSGSTYANPAANYYRALRDPLTRAEATAQVFLGVRIGCARCHNHPFDRWTMDEYYQFAAFFPRIKYRVMENNRRDKFDKHEFTGEQIVYQDRTGEVLHPRSGAAVPAKFLGANLPPVPADADRLQALADWVADPRNPFFARTQANRVWSHLLGKGIVEPNDDFRAANPPSNAALLDALADDFVKHQFDLRHLVATVLKSRTYQTASRLNATNRDDELNYAHALVQPLEAEQLYDALTNVIGTRLRFPDQPSGLRAGQLPGVQMKARGKQSDMSERFLKAFGKPDRLLSCDCERTDDTTLVQSFQLITGEFLNTLLTTPDNRIGKLLDAGTTDAAVLEEFYLAALCRFPTETESSAVLRLLASSKERRATWEDIVWSIVNAKEFLLRR
jgi:hypothetical protein